MYMYIHNKKRPLTIESNCRRKAILFIWEQGYLGYSRSSWKRVFGYHGCSCKISTLLLSSLILLGLSSFDLLLAPLAPVQYIRGLSSNPIVLPFLSSPTNKVAYLYMCVAKLDQDNMKKKDFEVGHDIARSNCFKIDCRKEQKR